LLPEFFIDTANMNEMAKLVETGPMENVNTNPSLIAKTKPSHQTTLAEICHLVDGPMSAEVTATKTDATLQEITISL